MNGSNGSEWITRRIDHLEIENEKLRGEIHHLREEIRNFKDGISSNVRALESITKDMPDMQKQFNRNRGISDGLSFISRTLIAIGATVSAVYAIWSLFGDSVFR